MSNAPVMVEKAALIFSANLIFFIINLVKVNNDLNFGFVGDNALDKNQEIEKVIKVSLR